MQFADYEGDFRVLSEVRDIGVNKTETSSEANSHKILSCVFKSVNKNKAFDNSNDLLASFFARGSWIGGDAYKKQRVAYDKTTDKFATIDGSLLQNIMITFVGDWL